MSQKSVKLQGIKDLTPFLNFLDSEKVYYRIDHLREDSFMVSFTLVGLRAELDFFDDHIEFSVFKGSEGVESDPDLFFRLFQEHWGD